MVNTARLRSLEMEPRLLTREQAAAVCGLSPEGFDVWRRKGMVPGPLPGTHRFDRKALDAALDKLSGIEDRAEETPLQKWRRNRDEGRLERRA
jgi:hypothetical protein